MSTSNMLPDKIVQEIRCLVAFQCRDVVMNDKAKGEESKSQKLIESWIKNVSSVLY
jgi:hypothetical protein